MSAFPRAIVFILAAGTSLVAGARDDLRLPDIGSSAAAIITPQQERQIGEQMLRSLRGARAVADDPLLDEYLSAMGYRLVSHSERPEQAFTFFVVRSEQINAFAAPGGFIGMNTGLIATAENESEVAAVLAHEVAHVTQRHILRAVESMQQVSLPIMLAMLGVLIAAQGADSADAAQAAVVGGSALLQQQQINFTRGNEYEADRIGIQILARAGYDPQAMASFFWRMGRATRANTGEGVPEFLRTHPVTATRISEAKDRATQIAGEIPTAGAEIAADAGVLALYAPPSATGGRLATLDATPALREQAEFARTIRALRAAAPPLPRDPGAFMRFRERARVLGSANPGDLIPFYRRTIEAGEGDGAAMRYGLALALTRAGQPRMAIGVLAPLAADAPDEITYALALADAEDAAGRPVAARERLSALAARFPAHRAVAIAHAQQLVASGSRQAASTAAERLRPLLAGAAEDALLQLTFARASELAGDEIRAGEAHAEVALLNGRFDDALKQLNDLLRRSDVDYYQRARIEARIAQITPVALEQRRRAIPGQA
ncbi:MAG: M48 family metalloprotease [Pseudomonadota bacterium]|jgi:predicted Zn-dependent protease